MPTNISALAIVAAVLLALATPAGAQWTNHQSLAPKSTRRTHRHEPPKPDTETWGRMGAAQGSHQDDCPNGDCRGVNSPGNLGGAHGDF
jgi:hypothetical protein